MKKIIGILLFGLLGVTLFAAGDQESASLMYPIVSLEKDSALHGKWFFLGGGYLNDERVYFTYAVMPDGGYRLLKMSATSTIIYEENAVEPHVVIKYHSAYNIDQVLRWLAAKHWEVNLYVPVGTIIKEFRKL